MRQILVRKSLCRPLLLTTTLFVLLLLVVGCGSEPAENMAVGNPLPGFELSGLEGTTLRGEALVGRPTLLAFWATWCQPCLREIPLLQDLHRDPRLDLVTIALDEGGERAVAPFVERRGLDYPVFLGDQETFRRLGGFAIPYALLIDEHGQVIEIFRGLLDRERVFDLLDRDISSAP